MKNKIFFGLIAVVFFGVFSSYSANAVSLEDLTSPELAKELLAGEKPLVVQFKDLKFRLTPSHNGLRELIGKVQKELNPSVMVETLHLYKKPPAAEKAGMSAEEEAGLYNETLALSTLAGLQYFSATRGTMRTFYETSSIIEGPSSKKALSDPVYPRPPSELTLYARQKDLTFGDNIYKYDFYYTPGSLIFVQENLTALTAGIIPAVGKNKLRSTVAVLDAEEYLLVYAVSMAKAASLPGMNDRVGNSFSNRAEAVIHWFSNQADKAFKKAHGS